jgi:hypothetical protein
MRIGLLSYTGHWLGDRSPLGWAGAFLAGYPPPPLPQHWTCSQCGADRHPSSEFPHCFRFIWVLGWSTWCLCANDPTEAPFHKHAVLARQAAVERSAAAEVQTEKHESAKCKPNQQNRRRSLTAEDR